MIELNLFWFHSSTSDGIFSLKLAWQTVLFRMIRASRVNLVTEMVSPNARQMCDEQLRCDPPVNLQLKRLTC